MIADRKNWDLRGTVAATLIMLLMAAAPRSAATLLLVGVAGAIVWLAVKAPEELNRWRPSTPVLAVLAFAAFAFISVIWSADRASTLTKVGYLAAITVGCEFLLTALDRLKPAVRARIFFANLAALLIAFAYAAFESGSMQFVAREVYSAFPRLYRNIEGHVTVVDGIVTLISETNINRRVGLMTLLIWPTALMLAGLAAARWRRAGWVVLALLSSIMIWASGHQSSQLAIIAGVGAFGLALRWPVAARRVVAIAWVAVVMLIVPICTLAFKASLQEASWLPLSARHRVVIWAYTANEVVKARVLGIGADATQSLFKEQMMRQGERKQVDGFELVTNRHAHNGYLQIWYELGFAGAALFMIAGLVSLFAIGALPAAVQPFAVAQFATFAGIIATSYGIWQMWFQASIALGAVALLATSRLLYARDASDQQPVEHDRSRPAPPLASGDLVT